MRGESKAKRRVTLSLCGLAFLDELEVQSIPDAIPEQPEVWRGWKTPEDAIAWASSQLPDYSKADLEKLLYQTEAKNGKKAPLFAATILELANSNLSHAA